MLNKYFWILLIILFHSQLIAQQEKQYDIFQLRFLYNEVKFNDVIQNGRTLLSNPGKLSKDDLIEIHKYLALSFYNISQQDSSRSHFYSILSLNLKFEPDPVQTSPKILNFFKEIKEAFNRDIVKKTAVPFKQYVFVEDIRSQAAVRSLILPGWGQWHKKQETKAYIFGGAFLATTLTTIIAYQLEKELKDKYRNEINPAQVTKKYNDYNSMSKMRRFFMYSSGIVWGLSLADAIFSDYQPHFVFNDNFSGVNFVFYLN